MAWAATHAGELAGVGVPLIGGAVWSPWLCLLSVPGAAAWVVSELRLRRTTRTARTAITSANPGEPSTIPAAEQAVGTGERAGTTERKEAHR